MTEPFPSPPSRSEHAMLHLKNFQPLLALSLLAAIPSASAQLNQTVFSDDGRNFEGVVRDTDTTSPPTGGFDLERVSFRYNPATDNLDIRIQTDALSS